MTSAPDLRTFFNPRSIAIVGASADPMAISGRPLRILRQHGYGGELYPVNPKYGELQGVPVYPSIGRVPGPVDLALVAVPARLVGGVLEECAAAGTRFAMVFSSGFAEAGEEGAALQETIRGIVERTSLRICGPNCEGFFNATERIPAGFSPAIDPDRGYTGTRAGPVGIVAQSGGLSFALFNRGLELGLGFSTVISTGNEVDLESLDFVEYLIEDPNTRVILAFVESFKRPRRLIEVARKAAAQRKPLIVAKIGRSEAGRRAAASHTGSLVGSDEAYEAAFRQLGVIRVDDVDEMLDAATYFSIGRLPRGRRVAVLTASGGGGAWLADACAGQGLELPEPAAEVQAEIGSFLPVYGSTLNPVDVTAQAIGHGGLERALELLLRSDGFDAVAVVTTLAADNFFRMFLDDLRRVASGTERAVLYYSYTTPKPGPVEILRELGIPCFTTPGRAARALARACWYGEFLERMGEVAVFDRAYPHPAPARRSRNAVGAGAPVPPPLRGRGDPPPQLWSARLEEASTAHGERAGAEDPLLRSGRGTAAKQQGEGAPSTPNPRTLLAPTNIPAPPEGLARSAEEAVALFRALGGPVALKVQSPGLPHKTDVGGVRLDLGSEAAVREAYDAIVSAVYSRAPEARIDGLLVQRMAVGGVEVILGARVDPDFGPLVLAGLGGIMVEVLRDVALRLAPVSPAEARGMVEELRGATILRGARGRPPADVGALVEAIVSFSEVAAGLPADVSALEINPLLVLPEGEGVVMVDARVEGANRR